MHRAKGFTWCLPELQLPSGEVLESVFFFFSFRSRRKVIQRLK